MARIDNYEELNQRVEEFVNLMEDNQLSIRHIGKLEDALSDQNPLGSQNRVAGVLIMDFMPVETLEELQAEIDKRSPYSYSGSCAFTADAKTFQSVWRNYRYFMRRRVPEQADLEEPQYG